MKKLISILSILFFAIGLFAQGYQADININRNQSASKQYIAIALGGKHVLSNRKLTANDYDFKGKFSSVYLPDFATALSEYLDLQNSTNVGDQIHDSIPVLRSGIYKPTRSGEVNTATVTTDTCQYLRVGNSCTVSGSFTSDPTSATTETSFLITLPFASAITATEQIAGTAYCQTLGVGGTVFADVSGDKAKIDWITTADVASRKWSFTFTYRIQ